MPGRHARHRHRRGTSLITAFARRWLARLNGAILLAGCIGILATGHTWAGEIVRVDFAAAALHRRLHYNVYLPDGYAESRQNYPVLYLLHGYGEDAEEWVVKANLVEMIDTLIEAGEIPPCLVVMPSAGTSWYIDRQEKMETAIIRDLIPEVERHFHTIGRRSGRLIGGESMGGYGTLRFLLKYPELFQAAFLLSPAVYVPEPPKDSGARRSPAFQTDGQFDPAIWAEYNYPPLLAGFLARQIELPVYFGCGIQDQFRIDIHMAKLYVRWVQRRWSASYRLTLGGHDFATWRKLAPEALTFVFRAASRPEPRSTQPVTEIGTVVKTPG